MWMPGENFLQMERGSLEKVSHIIIKNSDLKHFLCHSPAFMGFIFEITHIFPVLVQKDGVNLYNNHVVIIFKIYNYVLFNI